MTKKKPIERVIFDNRAIPCYNCVFMGNEGKTPFGDRITWCHLQHLIVGPEIGCNNGQYRKESNNASNR
jgi:hypothetical protein